MHVLVHALQRDEKGAALIEYGLLIGLIAVICAAAVTLLGQEISGAFSFMASALGSI
jgi:pilus assembly protein Flp/PilA